MVGSPQECQARTAAPAAAFALNKPGLCGQAGVGQGLPRQGMALVSSSESYGTGTPGEAGRQALLPADSAHGRGSTRGKSIIDEESGCASALSGWARAPWHRPRLANRAQAGPGPAAGPTLTTVGGPRRGVGTGELLGSPQGQGADFPRGLPWGPPVSELPSATACPPQVPPARPPYPLGAPAELVLCVPQGHRVLVDIIGHSHHLEHQIADTTRPGGPLGTSHVVLHTQPRPQPHQTLHLRTAPSHRSQPGQAQRAETLVLL